MNKISILFFSLALFVCSSHPCKASTFKFPNTTITVVIDGTKFVSPVEKNVAKDSSSDIPKYQNGFSFTEKDSNKGKVSYEFIGKSKEGDVYIFTVERPHKKREVIPYVFSGIGETFSGGDGITISIQMQG